MGIYKGEENLNQYTHWGGLLKKIYKPPTAILWTNYSRKKNYNLPQPN